MPGFVCGEAQGLEGVNGLKPFPLEKLHKTSLIVALKNAFPLAGRGLCFHFPCFSGFPQPFSHLHCLRKRQVEIVEFSAHHTQSYSRRRKGQGTLLAASGVAGKAVAGLPSRGL